MKITTLDNPIKFNTYTLPIICHSTVVVLFVYAMYESYLAPLSSPNWGTLSPFMTIR